MPFKNPIVGGTTLVRKAINSPNFVAGVSGWTINQDGSAEFNNAVFRGDVVVGTAPELIEITNVIPPELIAFYSGVSIIGAYIRQQPNDFGYYYMLAAVDSNLPTTELSWASGWVILPAATVFEQGRSLLLPGDTMVRDDHGTVTPYVMNWGPLSDVTYDDTSLPRGIVAGAQVATLGTIGGPASGQTDVPKMKLTLQASGLQVGRAYEIAMQLHLTNTVATDTWNIAVRLATALTGTQIGSATGGGGGTADTALLKFIYIPAAQQAGPLFFSFARNAGTGTYTANGSPNTGVNRTWASCYDIGSSSDWVIT